MKKYALMSALALVAFAGVVHAASSPEVPAEVLEEQRLKAPFVMQAVPAGEEDTQGANIARATERLSERLGRPPLLELPGKVMAEYHKASFVPFGLRTEKRETLHLLCSVALRRTGLQGIADAMVTPYFSVLKASGPVPDTAYDEFVKVGAAYRGYITYGHLISQTLEASTPGIVNLENVQAVTEKIPGVDSESFGETINLCARLSLDIANGLDTSTRLQMLDNASSELDRVLAEMVPAQETEKKSK